MANAHQTIAHAADLIAQVQEVTALLGSQLERRDWEGAIQTAPLHATLIGRLIDAARGNATPQVRTALETALRNGQRCVAQLQAALRHLEQIQLQAQRRIVASQGYIAQTNAPLKTGPAAVPKLQGL